MASKDIVWMEDTRIESTLIMHPQNRNVHGKIFGGYLMQQAFELAFCTAYKFNFCRNPIFRSVNDTHFLLPVEIGSFLQLFSKVIYTEGELVHVQITSSVLNPGVEDEPAITNVFIFLMQCPNNKKSVVPRIYGDAMDYLQGRRYHAEIS